MKKDNNKKNNFNENNEKMEKESIELKNENEKLKNDNEEFEENNNNLKLNIEEKEKEIENLKNQIEEINTNPGLEESSPLIKMLVPRMIDDAFRLTIDKVFDNVKNNNGNSDMLDKNKSKFSVEGYTDEENMWQKIKKI